jgi:NAD(P)-dependent dehydrogenase (short-subunit alcohol dehydrogenase family)
MKVLNILEGKSAIVTGAASAERLAELSAQQGAKVVLVDVRE